MTESTLSAIELEMQKAQESYNRKIKRLKAKAADEEKRVIAKLVEVLKTEHEDVYAKVRAEAVRQLEQERTERSKAAKEARRSDESDEGEAVGSEHEDADDASTAEALPLQRSA